jgi:hypothetical protein
LLYGSVLNLESTSYRAFIEMGLSRETQPAGAGLGRVEKPIRIDVAAKIAPQLGDRRDLDIRQIGEGSVDALFEHWILGRAVEHANPRWSIWNDVLRADRRSKDPDQETKDGAGADAHADPESASGE